LTHQNEWKRAAAVEAVAMIEDGMVLGLGTGSTVNHLLAAIAERRKRGELRRICGIPTSRATRDLAVELGIPLTDFTRHHVLDLALDGADEFDPRLDLIKGLGGALLREKIVATAARRFVVLADDSKRVQRLGTRSPLPVEVDPFGVALQERFLATLGAEPRLRIRVDGTAAPTDGGNMIFDCHFPDGISDAHDLAARLDHRTGIFEHGLFLGMTEAVIVAGGDGVRVLRAPILRVPG